METEPESSSLPAEDTSAMKYVSTFSLFMLFSLINNSAQFHRIFIISFHLTAGRFGLG